MGPSLWLYVYRERSFCYFRFTSTMQLLVLGLQPNVLHSFFRQKSLGSRLVAEIGLQANKYSTLTLVRPKLEYASSVWNPYKQCNIDKIEMVQCRVARFVFSDYSHCSHVSVMINKLGLSRASQTTQSSVYVLQIYKEQLFIYICLFMHFY